MKKTGFFLMFFVVSLGAFSQEHIQQPSVIKLYTQYNGEESAFFDNVVLQYDSCGRITALNHTINYPYYPLYDRNSYEYDSIGNLVLKKFSSFQGDSQSYYGKNQYYTYDQFSNLTEYYSETLDKFGAVPEAKQIYEYDNNTLVKIHQYNYQLKGEWIYAYYIVYSYSDDGNLQSETRMSSEDLPLGRKTYTYSNENELTHLTIETVDTLHHFVNQFSVDYEYDLHKMVSKTEKAWSKTQSTWIDSTHTEYRYVKGLLVEKDFTCWAADTISVQTKELRSYDDKGSCILIVYETMVDSVFTPTNRAVYAYDDDNLCIAAFAQNQEESVWVKGSFSHDEPLFLNYGYAKVNKELGTLKNKWRAAVTGYTTTLNPYHQTAETYMANCVAFPNPGCGIMKVLCDLDKASIRVFDMNGRCVKTQRINHGITTIVMDDVPLGMYLWQIWSGGSVKASGKWINND